MFTSSKLYQDNHTQLLVYLTVACDVYHCICLFWSGFICMTLLEDCHSLIKVTKLLD